MWYQRLGIALALRGQMNRLNSAVFRQLSELNIAASEKAGDYIVYRLLGQQCLFADQLLRAVLRLGNGTQDVKAVVGYPGLSGVVLVDRCNALPRAAKGTGLFSNIQFLTPLYSPNLRPL